MSRTSVIRVEISGDAVVWGFPATSSSTGVVPHWATLVAHRGHPRRACQMQSHLIFLLLIFFMLTSSFVTPSGLPVNLPTSKASTIEVQKVSITVTKNLQYFINDKRVTKSTLEAELKPLLAGSGGVVVLHIDESVPTKELVFVAGIATSLEAKVTLATKPK